MLNNVLDSADIAYIASKNMNYLVSTKLLKAGDSIVEGANYSTAKTGYYFASWGNYLTNGVDIYPYNRTNNTTLHLADIDDAFPTDLNEMVFNTYPSNQPEPIDPDAGEPEPEPENLILTQVLIDDYKDRHFTLKDIAGVPLAVGDTLNDEIYPTYLYAYADDGYQFPTSLKLVDYDGVEYPFSNNPNAVLNILSGQLQNLIVENLVGEATLIPVVEYTKISAQNIIDFANSNVRVYLDGVEAVEGAKLNSVEFKAVCNTGFKFTDDSAYIVYENGTTYDYRGNIVPKIITTYLLLNANYSEAITTTVDFNYSEIVLNTVVDDVPTISGTNSIYLINNSILDDVNENRWVVHGEDVLDYGVYILSLSQFPFDIPDNILGGSETIKLADRSTGVNAVTLENEVFRIDLGVINVTGDKGNLLDYVDKVAMIHLPFSQPIDLDLNYVINETISVEYLVSVYTGEATINISSSKLGGVISTTTSKIGVNIPYISNATLTTINNDSIDLGGNNGVTRPYIEIVETDKILADGFYTIPVIDESVLTGQTGFIRIEEINLKSNASKQNKELLISLLKEGVIIND